MTSTENLEMSARGEKRKKDKRFYRQNAKLAKLSKFSMVPGLRGFLLVCNGREKDTIREGYRILNDFCEENDDAGEDDEDDDDDDDLDVDEALDREKSKLDKESAKKVDEKRFQVTMKK